MIRYWKSYGTNRICIASIPADEPTAIYWHDGGVSPCPTIADADRLIRRAFPEATAETEAAR